MKKSFNELVVQTQKMIDEFQKVEQKTWGVEGAMIELSKQVGDLSKHIMVQEKYYLKSRENKAEYETTTQNIADELFDVWFCLIRIADYYKIDFEQAIDGITQKELDNFKKGRKSKKVPDLTVSPDLTL